MKWRIIRYSEYNAFQNMAIDESVSESVASGLPPTIRFYGWKPSAISIGYFQNLEKEVNTEKCSSSNIDIVRRRTGGGAVYHDNLGEITYSVIAKEDVFPKDIIASYREICGWIVSSLALLEITSEFKPINDIVVSGKKISGNAQTRRNGVLLQHGTLLYSVDVDKMFSLLNVSDEKIRDKMIGAVKERVTSVSQLKPNLSKDDLYKALLQGFSKGKQFSMGQLSESELIRAENLVKERYSREEWNRSR